MTNHAPPPITFIDNPHAPEVFAFRVCGIAVFADNVHLTLEAPRVNHNAQPGPVNRVVIGRIVMPRSGAENLRDLLVDYLRTTQGGDTTPQTIDPRKLN